MIGLVGQDSQDRTQDRAAKDKRTRAEQKEENSQNN
jgi:hypothetical protein